MAEWVTPRDGRTPGVIVSVAHLDDEERALVLGVVLEEILSWVRGLPGSSELKALIVSDEVYGYLPPHPANPSTKRPIVSLMKQAPTTLTTSRNSSALSRGLRRVGSS